MSTRGLDPNAWRAKRIRPAFVAGWSLVGFLCVLLVGFGVSL